MRIAREIGDKYEAARCQRTMGLAEAERPRRVAALEKAERTFRTIGSLAEAAITAHLLGRLGGEDSPSPLGRALAGFESCGLTGRSAGVLCDLADAYLNAGRHERALKYLDRAERVAGRGRESRRLREVRSRIDADLSRALSVSSSPAPRTVCEAHALLSACADVSGLALMEIIGGAPRLVEAHGLNPEKALALGRCLAEGKTSTRFVSDVRAAYGYTEVPDVRSLLTIPLVEGGSGGFVLLTWDSPVGEGQGSPAACVSRANFECRRLIPVLGSLLETTEDSFIPVCVCGIVSSDPGMKEVLFSLSRIAESSANVLITGETGTGKELVARAIHMLSQRADKPFVAQNCAALPEHLLESELFGHRSGAFTGARGEKRGLLEAAHEGIFFLDEVGDVNAVIQAKMLRALEAGEIRRVGDTASRRIDVRFLSATNRRLEEEVAEGRMRRDLYYRLNVVSIALPPLRERRGDICMLSRLFLRRFSARMSKDIKRIEDGALRALSGYDWPGNVRQLENEIERAVTMTPAREAVTPRALSPCITGVGPNAERTTLRAEVRTVERRRILAALRQHDWNKTHAARALGDISRPALIAKMKKLGIPLKRAETRD
jgi:transcriptional regulator with AAA-type ATPase domain